MYIFHHGVVGVAPSTYLHLQEIKAKFRGLCGPSEVGVAPLGTRRQGQW